MRVFGTGAIVTTTLARAAIVVIVLAAPFLLWGLCWLSRLADSTEHMIETPEDWDQ